MTAPEEEKIRDTLHGWIKEGAAWRLGCGAGGPKKRAHPSSLRGMLNMTGWVQCDLMLALCRADGAYRAGQRNFNPQLFDEKGEVRP
jgi:hypothetical protein